MYTRIYVLKFLKDIVDQPMICKLVKEFDVEFNILKAQGVGVERVAAIPFDATSSSASSVACASASARPAPCPWSGRRGLCVSVCLVRDLAVANDPAMGAIGT